MAGLLGFLAAGAAKGAGDGIVAEAKARREAAIKELENTRLVSRENTSRAFQASESQLDRASRSQESQADRTFRQGERVEGQEFTAEQNQLTRAAATSKAQGTPPEVKEFFDDNGQPYKAQWNPETQAWDKVGGSKAASNSSGVTVSPDGTVQIGGATLPAEMGSRIGLGDAFLKDLPKVRQQIESGEVNSVIERGQLAAGAGKPAAIWRQIESGKEALVRNLTGAGMSMSEAQNQAARYQISSTDSKETMLDKLAGLERDLIATRQGAIGAKTGQLSASPPQAGKDARKGAPSPGSTSNGVKWRVE